MAWLPAATAAAAAASRRREEEEAQVIDGLLQKDSDGRYEYKVLRSSSGAFKRPDRRNQVLMEEARAGWDMALMLDNSRLILRRDKKMREQDFLSTPGIDPYRIEVDGNQALFIALALFLAMGIAPLALALLLINTNGPAPLSSGILVIMGLVVLLLIVAVFIAIRRKRHP